MLHGCIYKAYNVEIVIVHVCTCTLLFRSLRGGVNVLPIAIRYIAILFLIKQF